MTITAESFAESRFCNIFETRKNVICYYQSRSNKNSGGKLNDCTIKRFGLVMKPT